VGGLNPDSPDATLFSPLDLWEAVLLVGDKTPPFRWILTIKSEFDFMDEYYLLTRWVRRSVSNPAGALGGIIGSMNARTISCNVPPTWNVQNVLFELDLLSVKEIGNEEVGNLWRALLQEFGMVLGLHHYLPWIQSPGLSLMGGVASSFSLSKKYNLPKAVIARTRYLPTVLLQPNCSTVLCVYS
jgi:hypothetical protein